MASVMALARFGLGNTSPLPSRQFLSLEENPNSFVGEGHPVFPP